MADIHVLTTPEQGGERVVHVLYHVPIDGTNNAYAAGPTPRQTSQIESKLDQSEVDALADGSLREVSHTFKFDTTSMTTSEMQARVEDYWHTAADDEQARIDTEYQHFLTELSRS